MLIVDVLANYNGCQERCLPSPTSMCNSNALGNTDTYQDWSGVWCFALKSSFNSQYPGGSVHGGRQSCFLSLSFNLFLHPSVHKPFNRIKDLSFTDNTVEKK